MDREAAGPKKPKKDIPTIKNTKRPTSTSHFFPPNFVPRSASPAHSHSFFNDNMRRSTLRRSFIDRRISCDDLDGSVASLSSSVESLVSLGSQQPSLVGRDVVLILDPWFFCEAVFDSLGRLVINVKSSSLAMLKSIFSQLSNDSISYTVLFYMDKKCRVLDERDRLYLRYPAIVGRISQSVYTCMRDFIACLAQSTHQYFSERNIMYSIEDVDSYKPKLNGAKRGFVMISNQRDYIEFAASMNMHSYSASSIVTGLSLEKIIEIREHCKGVMSLFQRKSRECNYICVSLDALIDGGDFKNIRLSYLALQLKKLTSHATIYIIEHRHHAHFFEYCHEVSKQIRVTYDEFSRFSEGYYFYGFLSDHLLTKKEPHNVVYYIGDKAMVPLLRSDSSINCRAELSGLHFLGDVVRALHETPKKTYASIACSI